MTRKTPPPKPADASPAPQPADPLLLPDGTPCIEGRNPDGTPYRMMKPADTAPPAPKLPVTIGDLRERIKWAQQQWIDCHAGSIVFRILASDMVADWWNDARMIPGAPPPPPMPTPFPGPSDDPQQVLRAADVLLRWLAELEAPPAMVHLTEEDSAILNALAKAHPKLLTQKQIEGTGLDVSNRTIQSRLPILLNKGLVCLPEGKRSGWGLTTPGLKIIKPAK